MSRFDQLTFELISRPSIRDDERLGLAELQLQRAQRMHWLMVGDSSENSETIQKLTSMRNDSLDVLQKKRDAQKLSKQQELEAKQLTELLRKQQQQQGAVETKFSDDLVQENEKPSKKDVSSRTPTPAMTPTEKEESPASLSAADSQLQQQEQQQQQQSNATTGTPNNADQQ